MLCLTELDIDLNFPAEVLSKTKWQVEFMWSISMTGSDSFAWLGQNLCNGRWLEKYDLNAKTNNLPLKCIIQQSIEVAQKLDMVL